jgi:hypothetical protein
MFKRLVTASLLCTVAGAFAQAPAVVGKVVEVQGVVTVSDGVTVATVVPGTVFSNGNQFVTASSGSARLTLDNGCDIRLKPNESIVIDGKKTCPALLALIQPLGGNLAAAGVGGTGTGLAAGLLGAATLLAAGQSGGGGAAGGGGGFPVVPISGQ